MNNIEIVESLGSLYPLKDFEEEAIMEVVAEFRELKEKATAKSPAYQGEHEKCPTCGSFCIGEYCIKCGQRIRGYCAIDWKKERSDSMSHIETLIMNEVRKAMENLERSGVGYIDYEATGEIAYNVDDKQVLIKVNENPE